MDFVNKTSCITQWESKNTQAITGKRNENYEMLTRANIICFEVPAPRKGEISYTKVPSNYTTKIHLVLNDSKSPSEGENPKYVELGLLLCPLF
jgi:hypothetical protein